MKLEPPEDKKILEKIFTDKFWNNGRWVPLNHKPLNGLVDKSMQNKKVKMYYGITSTTFGTGTQNVRRVDFPSSAHFSLPGK